MTVRGATGVAAGVLCLLCAAPSRAEPLEADALVLRVREGEQLTMDAPGVEAVEVGDPQIAGAEVDAGEVRVTGRRPGRTALQLRYRGGAEDERILLITTDYPIEQARSALEALGLTSALAGRRRGEEVVVEGYIRDVPTYLRFVRLQRLMPEVRYEVQTDPDVPRTLRARIDAALAAHGIEGLHASFEEGELRIAGVPARPEDRARAEQIAQGVLEAPAGVLGPNLGPDAQVDDWSRTVPDTDAGAPTGTIAPAAPLPALPSDAGRTP